MTTPQAVLVFVVLFFAGKACSWAVYRIAWRNAVGGDVARFGTTAVLLGRATLWPLHILIVTITWDLSWDHIDSLRQIVFVKACLLGWGSVFRFGAADLRTFFFADRLIVIALCVGVYFSPVFLYPAILSSCSLQYIVSRWRLGPGYSNLLGYEFIRGSSCVSLVGVVGCALAARLGISLIEFQQLVLAAWIGLLSSYYVNHALAKASLGRRWYSWIIENRVECLPVNAYLRGWRARRHPDDVLRFASRVRRFRIPICVSAFALEFGFLFSLVDRDGLIVLLIVATAFHFGVLWWTGLAELEFVVNHINLAWLLVASTSPVSESIFRPALFFAAAICMAITFACVGLLRRRILREFRGTGRSSSLVWADPFDHLMAWWDSPHMRMLTYVAITESGERLSIAVNKISPYDTALTDIHTHMMIFDQHDDLDPQAMHDKAICRSGVWGLLVDLEDRNRMYALMDEPMDGGLTDPALLKSATAATPWRYTTRCNSDSAVASLHGYFQGVNQFVTRWWFRLWMRRPHCPGEDLVPDVCPLSDPCVGTYRFDRPVRGVVVQRVKTFYTGDRIEVIEHSEVGRIDL